MPINTYDTPCDAAAATPQISRAQGTDEQAPILNNLFERSFISLHRLSKNNSTVVVSLLALNALVLPYAGFIHDASIYGFLVLNKIEAGRFTGDLFLRFGSQDQCSLFSSVVAPPARVLGLPFCFFLLYLVAKAMFFVALQRLVQALVSDRLVALLALIFLAVTPIPFAGLEVFNVNESFLTARLIAVPLVLFGLERLLKDRLRACLGLLFLALLIHPLMAFGGFLMCLGWWVLGRFKRSQVFGALVGLAGLAAVVLAYQPLGVHFFGWMDDEWRECVRHASPVHFPLEWTSQDWLRILLAGAITFIAWRRQARDRCVGRFLALLLTVSALGLGGAVLASQLPYALLFQGQPDRILWLLQIVQVPLGCQLATQWWALGTSSGRGGAIALVSCLGLSAFHLTEIFLFLAVTLIAVVWWRGLSAAPSENGWFWRSAVAGLGSVLTANFLWKFWFVTAHWNQLAGLMDPLEIIRRVQGRLDPLGLLIVCLGLLLVLFRCLGAALRFRAVAVATFLVLQAGFFAVPQTSFYQRRFRIYGEDLVFVEEFLRRHGSQASPPPTVYWPGASVDQLWLELRVDCYFESLQQLASILFNRDTAIEGKRRALLVKRFEIERFRRIARLLPPWGKERIELLFQADLDEGAPTRADIERLCREESLDFIVARQGFDGLYVATNGTWFIYACSDTVSARERQQSSADSTRVRPSS